MVRQAPLKDVPEFPRFLRRLKSEVAPSKVLLFGSRATGKNLHSSDIDLLIVSDFFQGMPWRKRMHLVMSYWSGSLALEPLCYTEAEFEKRSKEISIVREAARTGVPLRV